MSKPAFRVLRYAKGRDSYQEISERLTIPLPYGDRERILTHWESGPAFAVNELTVPRFLPTTEIRVEFERISHKQRSEEVVEIMEWGDNTVHFIDYWYVTFSWLVPTSVNGESLLEW